MAVDFLAVANARDALVNSVLELQKGHPDGLWRSQPDRPAGSRPSFTCTALAIQALTEALGVSSVAQAAAWKTLKATVPAKGGKYRPLGAESRDARPHIMNNSWALFAILECLPGLVEQTRPGIEWLIEQQRDGWWSLLPDEEPSGYPIFTAYAMSTLSQYLNFARQTGTLATSDDALIVAAIHAAYDKLMSCRAPVAIQHELLLWHTKGSDPDTVGYGTSAICAHVIDKAGRAVAMPHWSQQVRKTYVELAKGFRRRSSDREFYVKKTRVVVWDEIHQVGSTSYSWSSFAPLSIATVLRLLGQGSDKDDASLMALVTHFVEWILNNCKDTARTEVNAGPDAAYTTVWSTAASVIVLSRVLKREKMIRGVQRNWRYFLRIAKDRIWQVVDDKAFRGAFVGRLVAVCLLSVLALIGVAPDDLLAWIDAAAPVTIDRGIIRTGAVALFILTAIGLVLWWRRGAKDKI